MTRQMQSFAKKRGLARRVARPLLALCILAAVAFPALWLGTWRTSIIVRRIGPGSMARVAVNHKSLVFTLDRFPKLPDSTVATYDLHVGSEWRLPPEWFAARELLLGVRLAATLGAPAERALVVPLWLPFLVPIVACVVALWRGHARDFFPKFYVVKRWARRAPLLACAAIGLLWLHSLCFRGWELDPVRGPFSFACYAPGALRITIASGAQTTPAEDGEWSGWVCRFMGGFSTHTQHGIDLPSPWRPFPGFGHETVIATDPFGLSPSRIVGYDWTIPYWALFLATGAIPIVSEIRSSRRRARSLRWQTASRCGQCGYDLRASTERCSECGAPITSHERADA